MGIFDLFDALLGPINPISRLLGGLSAIRHANYKRAAERDGVAGVVGEALGGAVGLTAFQFAIPREGAHALSDVQRLLRQYGVPTFTLLHDHENFYFSVKRTQARWAEYVLLSAGIDLQNAPFDPRNLALAAQQNPGYMPAPWSQRHPPSGDAKISPRHAKNVSEGQSLTAHIEEALSRTESFVLGDHRHENDVTQTPTPKSGRTRSHKSWLDQIDAFLDSLFG